MGILSLLKGKTAVPTNITPSFIPVQWLDNFISGYSDITDNKLYKYYMSVPELNAIINYRAMVKADMIVKMRNLRTGDDIDSDPILDLFRQPNVLQSFDEFIKQLSIQKDLYGNAFVHPVYGLTKDKSKAIFNMPSKNAKVIIKENGISPFNVTDISEIIDHYKFEFNNKSINHNPDEIIHFNDSQIDFTNDNWVMGKSKITAITQACENIITAYEARGMLMGNAPLGIISNRSKDGQGSAILDPKDKKSIQDNLRQYGMAKDKYKFIVSSSDLSWSSMAINISGLKLFEEVESDRQTISNTFGFPDTLLNSNQTYENIKEAKKQLYQDSIIPESNEIMQGFSKFFGLIDKGKELYADYSHVPSLQLDLESRSRTWNYTVTSLDKAFASQAITIKEYQEVLRKIKML